MDQNNWDKTKPPKKRIKLSPEGQTSKISWLAMESIALVMRFFKILKMNNTQLQSMGIQALDARQNIITAAQQCLAKYEFSAPFYSDANHEKKNKTSRFFGDVSPELLPQTDSINQPHHGRASP